MDLPTFISEAEYWKSYYEDSDHHYEWNNGYLEEKGASEKLTILEYQWFFELLRYYLRVFKGGEILALQTGFRLVLKPLVPPGPAEVYNNHSGVQSVALPDKATLWTPGYR